MAGKLPGAVGGLSGGQEGLGLEVLHEVSWRKEGAFDRKASNVLLGFGLGVEGGDFGILATGDLFDWRQSAEDDVLGPFFDSDVGDRLAAVVLDVQAVGAEGRRCHGEDGVRAGQSCVEGGSIEYIALDDSDLPLELLCLFRTGVAGDGSDLVLLGELWIVQHIVDD